jgi:hypothetical protein
VQASERQRDVGEVGEGVVEDGLMRSGSKSLIALPPRCAFRYANGLCKIKRLLIKVIRDMGIPMDTQEAPL